MMIHVVSPLDNLDSMVFLNLSRGSVMPYSVSISIARSQRVTSYDYAINNQDCTDLCI